MPEIISRNPATGKEIGRVQVPRDIPSIIEKVHSFSQQWAQMPLSERKKLFINLKKVLLRRYEEVAHLIAVEQGKPVIEAILAEVLPSLDAIHYLIKKGPSILRTRPAPHFQPLFAGKRAHYRFIPYGTWAVISPWNYPFAIPFIQISHLLFSGNTVVFKPSPITPLIGEKLVHIFMEAGFPEEAIAIIHGGAKEGEAIITDDRVSAVVFTGSVPTGRRIMELASKKPKKVILELGGKDPAIVMPDAPVERTAKGIVWGALMNAGQTCASIERVYVHREIYSRLVDAVVEEVRKIRVGNPLEDVDMGPMTVDFQVKKVLTQVEDAKKKGAQILTGGEVNTDLGPLFMEPTVLVNVNHDMAVMNEETFGPLIPIMPFDSEQEAIEMANSTPYGLTASIWTTNPQTARRIAGKLQAGVITINSHVYSFAEPESIWGGVKESGIGRTHGRFGLMETVQVQYVDEDFSGKSEMWWYPYKELMNRLSGIWLELMAESTFINKIRILTKLTPRIGYLNRHLNLPRVIWKTLWY